MGWSKTFEDNYEMFSERIENSTYCQGLQNDKQKTLEAVLITGQLLNYSKNQ